MYNILTIQNSRLTQKKEKKKKNLKLLHKNYYLFNDLINARCCQIDSFTYPHC